MEKLDRESKACDFAVIIMSGDDTDPEGGLRARENVMHEIGFFQGRYGRDAVVLLHEIGVSLPSNLHGIVYSGYPKGFITATFPDIVKELKAFYVK